MKILDFNERLKDSILIADGAMGSMLHEAVGTQRCFDELNATEPEAVFRWDPLESTCRHASLSIL